MLYLSYHWYKKLYLEVSFDTLYTQLLIDLSLTSFEATLIIFWNLYRLLFFFLKLQHFLSSVECDQSAQYGLMVPPLQAYI